MCILFIHIGDQDPNSDFRLILASNRDEFYDRPTKNMSPWVEDEEVVGGRDLEAGDDGGTWLAVAPNRRKIAALLNLPRIGETAAQTRGCIVKDYVKSDSNTKKYISSIKDYAQSCNGFIFVSAELGSDIQVQTYSNETDKINEWNEPYLGFSNSLPETPLKKVQDGQEIFKKICEKHNKITTKDYLINELIQFMRSDDKHLPDPQIKKHRPQKYEELSSIFVKIPEGRYGTRTHTIVLVSKLGHLNVIETTMQQPIDVANPMWETSEFQYDIKD